MTSGHTTVERFKEARPGTLKVYRLGSNSGLMVPDFTILDIFED